MDSLALWTGGISAAVFGLTYLRAMYLAYSVDKRAKLPDSDMKAMMQTKYRALEEGNASASNDHHHHHHHHHHQHKKLLDENGHFHKKVREFHRSALSFAAAYICGLFVLYYLAFASNVTNVERASDNVQVNPWRWLVALSFGTGAAHAVIGMACHFHVLSIAAFALHGGVGRIVAGIALLMPVGSPVFWVLTSVALVLSLASFLFVYWRHDRVAGSSLASRVTVWYCVASLAIHTILFLASYEVLAWLTYDVTIVANAVADALLFLLPALYLTSDMYYRARGLWPLLPRIIYDDYGMGHYWKGEAKPQLLYLVDASKKVAMATTTTTTSECMSQSVDE